MDIKNINFEQYQKENDHLTFEEMRTIHHEIITNADVSNEDFVDLWVDLIKAVNNYSETRAGWLIPEIEQDDSSRTKKHDVVIGAFLSIERVFQTNSWNSSTWTKLLFNQDEIAERTKMDVNSHRKRIGDFANYLSFVYALNSR